MKLLEQYTGLPRQTVLKDKAVHQLSTKQNKTKRRDMILSRESSSKGSACTLVGSAQDNLTNN